MDISLPKNEEKILKFWKERKIFEKSIKQRKRAPIFSFYDGPPFATGLPHYGHILATTIKDAVLRYWAMQGYQVPRRVGWDCHGLPIENLIEKELGLKTKKDIEKLGIKKFCQTCRNSVFRCVKEFQKTLERVGRWADYSNAYATMDNKYIESVWWVLAQLYKKGLVYKDFRVTPYCPRCGTPLSNFELNQPGAYQEIEDESIYVKFKIKTQNAKHKNAYLLVWTTTPWTLPANTAIAVNPKFDYVKVKIKNEYFILAKKQLSVIDQDYKVVKEFKGKELIGLRYRPLFKIGMTNRRDRGDLSYKVVEADFVSLEEGTGLVHIAPAFGVDDMELGKKENLPILITVDLEGKIIKNENIPGEGKFVKTADKALKADLEKRDLLFKQEKIIHKYPFCWRCDTPLLYYPLNSWYVAVTKFKKQLIENNKKIRWVPSHLKDGRFGKWLEEARDWSFSRNRYWGASIPIWECQKCKNIEVIGSRDELKKQKFSNNKYFILRHGIAQQNVKGIISITPENNHRLTKIGEIQIRRAAKKIKKLLKTEKLDLIFTSDFLRTRQTAEIVAKETGVKIKLSQQIRDINLGVWDGKSILEFKAKFLRPVKKLFYEAPLNGETWVDCRKRMIDFIAQIEKKYKNKNILIVSHGDPLWLLEGAMEGFENEEMLGLLDRKKGHIKPGELRQIEYRNFPYNKEGKLDFHRPYIDEVKFICPKCNEKMERVKEVFDCWFESGSMPYAQWHYPFENKKFVEKTFPADFIAEGIDQTRGWFYTLNVLSSAIFNQPAFKNVIVNGLVLGEDGKKLSKRLKNYTPPDVIFNKQGADALRYFLLSSTQIGENYIVSEKRIAEVFRRTILTLWNSFIFFDTYGIKVQSSKFKVQSLLDRWIVSKLNSLNLEVIKWMNECELTKAARAFDDFIDELSNWYIRRSRRRLQRPETKEEKQEACQVLYHILLSLTKLLAPFTPFISEEIYQKLGGRKESVHLEDYSKPNEKFIDKDLEEKMNQVREITALALARRAELGIKVRQPLASLKIPSTKSQIPKELLGLIKEEINVKEIIFDSKIKEEIELDTRLTSELKEEGMTREVIRQIQAMRKKAGYKPRHRVLVRYFGSQGLNKVLIRNKEFILKEIIAEDFQAGDRPKMVFDIEREIKINQEKLWLGIKKI
ncbi:isoleucyl-tRNA synthase [Parcubacteria bacterium DG_74_2]|nr:MAG: isoleucyl-tRNA synthase [Parcubacteria bacterium DG_74_2]